LPFHRIQRAHELREIHIQKDPAPSSLGPRNETTLGTRADFFRVHVEKRGGLGEVERFDSTGLDRALAFCRAGEPISDTARMVMI
jgi:hypothetical protein